MNFNSVSTVAPSISGAPMTDGNTVIDLAEVRAARARIAVAAPRTTPENVFEGLQRQASMVGAAAELMISGMNQFIDELEVLKCEMAVAKELCTACQDACELEDIDAMIEARDRLRTAFDECISGECQPTAE